METIRLGSQGETVTDWQEFLRGQDLYFGEAHGTFDEATDEATKQFQEAHGLTADGVVGAKSWGRAEALGFETETHDASLEGWGEGPTEDPGWPPKPADVAPADLAMRQKLFGRFQFEPQPSTGNPEGIKILGNWVAENIHTTEVPQLIGVSGAHPKGLTSFNTQVIPQLVGLFQAWEDAGLLPLIKSYGGSWAPRYIRGSRTSLSNHAWGTAFDLNVRWNQLKMRPALVGQEGSVRELVPLAFEFGFYWGGWFTRKDGMHFEAFRVLEPMEVTSRMRKP